MLVCTIAAEAGTDGELAARAVAAWSGAELFDRQALIALARELNPEIGDLKDIEERVGSRLAAFAMGLAITGSPEALRELDLKKTLACLGREVLREAAKQSAVILAPGAFMALRDHPSAVHVRLRAPLDWRIDAYRRLQLVDRRQAERMVKHEDHLRRAWVKAIHHVDADDPANFSLVVDASRVSPDRVAAAALAAAGVDVPLAHGAA